MRHCAESKRTGSCVLKIRLENCALQSSTELLGHKHTHCSRKAIETQIIQVQNTGTTGKPYKSDMDLFQTVSSSLGIAVVLQSCLTLPHRKKVSHADVLSLQKLSVPVSITWECPLPSKPFFIVRQETTTQILNVYFVRKS